MTTISARAKWRTLKLLTWRAISAQRNSYRRTITSLAVWTSSMGALGVTTLKRGVTGVGQVEGASEAQALRGCRPSNLSTVDNYLKVSRKGHDGKSLSRESSLIASSVVVTWREHNVATRRTASTFGWRVTPHRTWRANTTGHGSTSVLQASPKENSSHSPSRTSAIK